MRRSDSGHPAHGFSLEDYLSARTVQELAPSPDGRELAFVTNLDGTPQLWRMASDGGFPTQLTRDPLWRFNWIFAAHGSGLIRWSPDGAHLAYIVDADGNEQNRIRIVSRGGSRSIDLPWQPNEQCHLGAWAPDSDTFFYTSNRRDARWFDAWAFDLASKRSERIFTADDVHTIAGIAPEDGQLPILRSTTYRRTDLLLLNLRTGETSLLTPWAGEFEIEPVGYENPRSLLSILRPHGEEFRQLARFVRRGGAWTPELITRTKWDKSAVLSPDRRTVALTTNDDGSDRLQLLDLRSERLTPTRVPVDGTIGYVRFGGRSLYFAHGSHARYEDVHRLDPGKATRALTSLGNPALPDTKLSRGRLVHYRSGSHTISSWLYLPPRRVARNLPCLVWIHGGPQSQVRARYSPRFQYLASLGLALWIPNHRGSTGYGRSFQDSIDRHWGEVDMEDLSAGLAWLKKSGFVDTRRLAVIGGSYGGYMTLRALTRLPRAWKCGVDIFGPSNLFTMLASEQPAWRKYTEDAIGHPKRDRERLRSQSPLFEISRLRAPLLVIQGKNDPRVTKGESDQVVSALKRRRVPVDYLVFPDEGHGFSKRANELAAFRAIAAFVTKHLALSR